MKRLPQNNSCMRQLRPDAAISSKSHPVLLEGHNISSVCEFVLELSGAEQTGAYLIFP